jgi:AraC-like DNA-binding protein
VSDQINAVKNMQTYIEKHLHQHISLYDLAQISHYSPWYSAKIFKQYTGKTPFDYISQRRLTEAAKQLRDDEVKVIDVALDFSFETHEGFTRAFSKTFGLTPKKYQLNNPPIKWFLPYPVDSRRKRSEVKMASNTIFVQVIEKPKRKLILKRGKTATHYFEYCDEVGCDVWGILTSIKEALYEPMGLWLPDELRDDNTSYYAQGVEVPYDYQNEIPEGFDMIDLEPTKMMIFQGPPYNDEFFEDAIRQFKEDIKNYDPKIYGFEYDLPKAPKFQLEPQGYRGYIEGIPVKELK